MKYKMIFVAFFSLSLVLGTQSVLLFECPSGWEEYTDHCYQFVLDPPCDITDAKAKCSYNGANTLSITSDGEHNFVANTLDRVDIGQQKHSWWTSGKRTTPNQAEFNWDGDGTKIESFVYWHNSSIPIQKNKDIIAYYFDGYKWGWILETGYEMNPYICEISKDDIYMIGQPERGPDYGLDNPDKETVPRGPKFELQPLPMVYEPNDIHGYTYFDCEVDAYPQAIYEWRRERAGQNITIDPSKDGRYTMINGRLIIHSPSADMQDDGKYQCSANNPYGKIMSNTESLSFGYLQDFPKSPRAPVDAVSYSWGSIECSPPAHFPEVLYTWYKDDIYNFIRPELKPYIFISHDGRLYFSEVTTDDIGNYYCLVYKPGQDLAAGKVSMPTELRIREGSPGVYEPQIGSGFPLVYPSTPLVGDTVRLECWASGSSRINKLQYNWQKIEITTDDNGNQMEHTLPLPPQAKLSDHDRVVSIPNVQLYDAGLYKCTVRRIHGQSTNKTVELSLQSMPYFSVGLKDQFADIGTNLRWRCEATGSQSEVITYWWMRNGLMLNNQSISPEDRDRYTIANNVLYISALDPRDDGMYQCVAHNTHGTRYSTGQLKVLSFPPNFNKYPLQANQFATVKGNTTMFCRPESAPYPDYAAMLWYKNNVPLNPGEDSTSRVRKMPNGNLFVSDVQTADGGTYRCQVNNVHGKANTTGNLTVLQTTTLTQPPFDTPIQVNSTNFLHCVASYNPALDVTYVWYHGDMLVEFERVFRLGENKYEIWYNPNYKRGSGIYYGGLYIMNAQYEHTGRYTCMVESSSGHMSRNAHVQIYGPPSEPAGVYFDSTTVTISSVLIRFKAAGDNGRPIISYVVEAFNFWEGFWRILQTNVQATPDETGTMRVNVTGLQAYSRYMIRMRAENLIGTSLPSLPTDQFVTYAVIPDKHPDQVGGGGGKVGDLVVTWQPLPPWEHNGDGLGYRIFIKQLGDNEWDYVRTTTSDSGRFVEQVGENNYYLQYEVAVQSFNDLGDGPTSPIVVIRSAMGLPSVIAQNVRAQPYNATACLVHWHPVDDSREVVKGKLGGYRLSFWKECCETEDMAPRKTIEGQATEGMVVGLYPDTPYYFDVMVWNEAGNGPKSQYFIQRTLRRSPIDMPVEVQVERLNPTTIYLKWRGVSTAQLEEPLEGYRVRIWSDGEHLKYGTDYEAEKNTDLTIADLKSNVMYKLRVYAYSRGGMGTMSSPALKFTLGGSAAVKASMLCLLWALLMTWILRRT